ncbi:hypothetical protein H8E88_10110 [candidate division KSB1 bacterium]|nr:hypothetical protein [candidate division KSB1 bacterium]
MKLQTGVVGRQTGYKIILEQEGIPHKIIPYEKEFSQEEFPVLMLDYLVPEYNWNKLTDYVKNGGNLLISASSYGKIFEASLKIKQTKSLVAGKNSIYSQVGLIDIFSKLEYPKQNNSQALDENLFIYERKLEKGRIVILPFSANELLTDWSSRRKKFYAKRKELSSEIVATVSKNKIRKIIRISLEYLFYNSNLPFISKWYYPKGGKKAFLFRVDTDFCSQKDAEDLYEICDKFGINSTWFVDTETEAKLKNFYANLNSEVTLHCKEHKVFKDYDKNYENIKSGVADLQVAGIEARGFAAPFGEWNPALAKVLEDFDFEYSSEFTIDYGNLPFYPHYENEFSDVLQIPIHPVSLGRLRRSHFSQEEMLQYYKWVLHQKTSSFEPVIFYHHPHHRNFSVFEKLFELVADSDFWNPTFREYSGWWKKRNNAEFTPEYKDGTIRINPEFTMYVRISTKQSNYKILQAEPEINVNKIKFEKKQNANYPSDIARIRDFSWRDILYNFETWRAKKK